MLFGLIRRLQLSPSPFGEAVIITSLALLVSVVVFGAFTAFLGHDPIEIYRSVYRGAFGSWFSWQNTLSRAAPLMLAALCTAIPARMGLIIIGGEGALMLGGLAAAVTGIYLTNAPAIVVVAAMTVAGAIAGGLWIGGTGALRHYRGVNETLSSLLLVYLAVSIFDHFVDGPLRDPKYVNFPATRSIGEANMIGNLPGVDVHWGLVAGIVACIATHIFMRYTAHGFAIRLTGGNTRTAKLLGLSVGPMTLWVCATGGAAAGLAGMIEVAAVHGKASGALHVGYGYMGILVAFLARHNPIAIIPAALLTGGIEASSGLLQRLHDLPGATTAVFQGIVFIVILCSETLYGRLENWRALASSAEPS